MSDCDQAAPSDPLPPRWLVGEYPSLDKCSEWLQLAALADRCSTDPSPHIPDAIYQFRREQLSELVWAHQFFDSQEFARIYGTADIVHAINAAWVHYFGTMKTEPSQCTHPKFLSLPPSHPDITAPQNTPQCQYRPSLQQSPAPPPQPFPHPRAHDFGISKTVLESSRTVGSPLCSQSAPAGSWKFTTLPTESDCVPMGSGVSCGIVGRGGMGIVYKVYVAALEVMRAVKVLELWTMCDTQLQADHFVRRHAMEAKITAQLQHPNIVTLHHYGSFDGLPCLEMEYVEGMDLKQLICRHRPLALSLVTALGILFTRGIAHAHSRHYTLFGRRCSTIMHRDIKPANILISFEGAVKVTDFGIARPLELSLNTVANAMIGTLCYMSPEQMQGQQLDTRTDIYALGATLYELLCGQQLFPQENLVALMNARQTNSFQPLGSLRHGIPRPLISLVNGCVHPIAQQRIGSAEAILDILESVHGKLTKARPEQVVREFMRGCAATLPPANPPIR